MSQLTDEELARYLTGSVLYGDDFDLTQVAEWFDDEREGYTNLPWEDPDEANGVDSYWYGAMNEYHGFRYLPDQTFRHALGLGSAYGGEFLSLADRIDRITIVEPSKSLRSKRIGPIAPTYVDPRADGQLPFADGDFDLALLFGVLHHIPNVTAVVREVGRVVARDGYLVLREPIISMGDWRQPRQGLTKRERGIPRDLLISAVERAGFDVVRARPCMNPMIAKAASFWPALGPDRRLGVRLDAALCRAINWNYRYHANSKAQKVRPTSLSITARRR